MTFERPTSQLAQEYNLLTRVFNAQPPQTHHFLEKQVGVISAAIENNRRVIHLRLPERIIMEDGTARVLDARPYKHTLNGGLKRPDQLVHNLELLEKNTNPAMALFSKVFRFALARHILYQVLPDGHSVQYLPENEGDIPSIPSGEVQPSKLLTASVADVYEGATKTESHSNYVPYVDAARHFFLPQLVVFGEDDRLLTSSLEEAEATINSLRDAVRLLQKAIAICPSLVTDETYQRKRAGLTGQLVNQGRALARAYTREIIKKIRVRANSGSLNRGLHLSLPYFDDNNLAIRIYPIKVIPRGLIPFVPAFIVRAMVLSEIRVQNDLHLNTSTRRHLVTQLRCIEAAFDKYSTQS